MSEVAVSPIVAVSAEAYPTKPTRMARRTLVPKVAYDGREKEEQ